jgi:hypothetical protein
MASGRAIETGACIGIATADAIAIVARMAVIATRMATARLAGAIVTAIVTGIGIGIAIEMRGRVMRGRRVMRSPLEIATHSGMRRASRIGSAISSGMLNGRRSVSVSANGNANSRLPRMLRVLRTLRMPQA